MQSLRHLNSALLFVAISLWSFYFVSVDGGLKAPPVYEALSHSTEETSNQLHATDSWLQLINTADAHYADGRYDLAKPVFEQALTAAQDKFGDDHRNTATSLDRLGITYVQLGDYSAAAPLLTQALSLRENLSGSKHPETASSLNNLARLYQLQTRLNEAESLYRRALSIDEANFGRRHATTATRLGNLASLLSDQAKFPEAEKLFLEVLGIRETLLGANHPMVGRTLNNLAVLLLRTGRNDRAEPLLLRALQISESSNGKNHPITADLLNNLGGVYMDRGDYVSAERDYRRALSIKERSLGSKHPETAQTILNLGLLFEKQKRFADAERFFLRALTINEATLGENHPETGRALNNIARLYQSYGMLEEADPLFWRAYTILADLLGEDHPRTATALNNWAVLSLETDDTEKAEELLQRTLQLQKQALGNDHPAIAETLNNLASVYQKSGRFSDAQKTYEQSIEIKRSTLGPAHPSVALGYHNLAYTLRNQSQTTEALAAVRQSSDVFARRAELYVSNSLSEGARSEFISTASTFQMHSSIAWDAAQKEIAARQDLSNEAFISAQWAEHRKVSDALAQMSARLQTEDSDMASLARDRQDLVNRWRAYDTQLMTVFDADMTAESSQKIALLRDDQKSLEDTLDEIDAQIASQFPAYAQLSQPLPLDIAQSQDLLETGEALIFFLAGQRETYVWVITNKTSAWHKLSVNREDLDRKVQKLRKGLSGPCCGAFDLSTSHRLYLDLMKPIENVLEGSDRLIIVPSGSLQSLPFSLLTTSAPSPDYLSLANYQGYRQASWLIADYAITTLPDVSSLKALRSLKKTRPASEPFIGFGNPNLSGDTQITDQIGLSPATFFRGTQVDIAQLQELSPLGETEAELRQIANTLGAPQSEIFVGPRATERAVKTAALERYRILGFATHGLVAGELDGLAEPALVFTPPDNATPEDDGLLTASEVAQLKLNADWVLLSACNTVAGDSLGAEPLSGLAKAFFYAGSTALLVSHWPVQSNAAVELTTGAFATLAENPSLGRSEALRRSILSLLKDTSSPTNAHPAIWAPFVIVGDGR